MMKNDYAMVHIRERIPMYATIRRVGEKYPAMTMF